MRPYRPRDGNQLAKRIVDIATGQVSDDAPPPKEPVPARARSGHARAANLTPEQRSEIARKGAEARWHKSST